MSKFQFFWLFLHFLDFDCNCNDIDIDEILSNTSDPIIFIVAQSAQYAQFFIDYTQFARCNSQSMLQHLAYHAVYVADRAIYAARSATYAATTAQLTASVIRLNTVRSISSITRLTELDSIIESVNRIATSADRAAQRAVNAAYNAYTASKILASRSVISRTPNIQSNTYKSITVKFAISSSINALDAANKALVATYKFLNQFE